MTLIVSNIRTLGEVMETTRPLIVAHRGFSGRFDDNSPEAFKAAFELPIHGVECDVRLTRDGELVVAHDPVSSGDGLMPFSDLLAMFANYPEHHLYVEIKHNRFNTQVQERTLQELRRHGLDKSDRVHIISFSRNAVRYFRKRAPLLDTYFLLGPRTCWLPAAPVGLGPSIVRLNAKPALIGRLGVRTYTWTVNTPRQMLWCAEHGVDVLATDLPDLALETLASPREEH